MGHTWQGKTLFITGSSRGIGLAIARKFAQQGANIAVAAKTTEPHPKLPGTIYTACEELESLGGKALPLPTDIRFDDQVAEAVKKTADTFGGIDVLINNASAIYLLAPQVLKMKQYDLMHQVNGRGTYLCSTLCYDYLAKAKNPHILNISPPLNMHPGWFKSHVAYTQAKYLMSMSTLGMAESFKGYGIAVNSLWPKTAIDTSAVRNLMPISPQNCRKPNIMADAAYWILQQQAGSCTGQFFLDEEVLRKAGVKDFSPYAFDPDAPLIRDAFIGEPGSFPVLLNPKSTKNKK